MSLLEHPSIAKFRSALVDAGMAEAAARIRIFDDEVRTAAAAAAALGVEVGAIANSLVFGSVFADRVEPLLAITSGAHRADTDALATIVGASWIVRAEPAFVREHTGQAIGGVAPLGHPVPVPTVVDRHLRVYDVVWAAAGHAKAVFPTTFDGLIAMTGGTAADFGQGTTPARV